MNFHSRLTALREHPDTARAGMKWTDDEDVELMERATSNMDMNDIAKAHKRTITGVMSRIMSNALSLVEEKSMTLEDVSKHVHIPLEDLEAYKQRQDDKKNAQPKKTVSKKSDTSNQNDEKYMKILIEIRDLLRIIAEK